MNKYYKSNSVEDKTINDVDETNSNKIEIEPLDSLFFESNS